MDTTTTVEEIVRDLLSSQEYGGHLLRKNAVAFALCSNRTLSREAKQRKTRSHAEYGLPLTRPNLLLNGRLRWPGQAFRGRAYRLCSSSHFPDPVAAVRSPS